MVFSSSSIGNEASYEERCQNLDCVANVDSCSMTWLALEEEEYFILVAGNSLSFGNFGLEIAHEDGEFA